MNAAAAIHLFALATCFVAHFAFAEEFDGVRRAMQTMAAGEGQTKIAYDLPAVSAAR